MADLVGLNLVISIAVIQGFKDNALNEWSRGKHV